MPIPMYTLFGVVLIIASNTALEISHKDLDKPERICKEKASCNARYSQQRNYTARSCMCDGKCAQYGDCCVDSAYFDDAKQRRTVSTYNCSFVESVGNFYMKQNCVPSWSDVETRRNCEKSSLNDYRDPLLVTPVTNLRTNITYGNVYCAICNEDAYPMDALDYWQQGLDCHLPKKYDEQTVARNLTFNATEGYWQVRLDRAVYNCAFYTFIPNRSKTRVTECEPTIRTCPAGFVDKNDTKIRSTCESYTSVVYASSPSSKNERGIDAYRNAHCAICNGVPVQHLHCDKLEIPTFRFWPIVPSLTVIFDFKGPCPKDSLYDRFAQRCREFDEAGTRGRSGLTNCTDECGPATSNASAECRRICESSQYSTNSGLPTSHSYKVYFSVITTAGLFVSILCLSAHLVVFVLLPDLRNLSGKNLASLCFALLTAYTSFAAGNAIRGKACQINAIITFYFFLAAFSWMLIMSFDVWRSLKIATKELRVSSGKQWRKFFIYSVCGWVLPAKIVLVALLVELCPSSIIHEQLRPKFGHNFCWFGSGTSLLLFFGVPVFLILIFNFSFFVGSAIMIYSSHSMARYSASPATKRDFKLYARLSIAMGMTWMVAIVAAVANIEILWLLFVLSNSFLGLFIFLSFTWRKSTLHGLKSLKRGNVLTSLPTFNWSMPSSSCDETKTQNGSSKPTSNTYY